MRAVGTYTPTDMPNDDFKPEELAALFLQDDHDRREQRTLRHEAGHATVAWLIRDDIDHPPFEYIEVGTMQEHAGGVVPGGVRFDVAWFDTLSPVEQGAILLAGIYVQDGAEPYSAEEWRQTLDGLEGADGVDDYARAIDVCRQAGAVQAAFDESVRAHLAGLSGLDVFLNVVAATLKPGQRTTAAVIVAALKARLVPPNRAE